MAFHSSRTPISRSHRRLGMLVILGGLTVALSGCASSDQMVPSLAETAHTRAAAYIDEPIRVCIRNNTGTDVAYWFTWATDERGKELSPASGLLEPLKITCGLSMSSNYGQMIDVDVRPAGSSTKGKLSFWGGLAVGEMQVNSTDLPAGKQVTIELPGIRAGVTNSGRLSPLTHEKRRAYDVAVVLQ